MELGYSLNMKTKLNNILSKLGLNNKDCQDLSNIILTDKSKSTSSIINKSKIRYINNEEAIAIPFGCNNIITLPIKNAIFKKHDQLIIYTSGKPVYGIVINNDEDNIDICIFCNPNGKAVSVNEYNKITYLQ